MFKIPEIPPPPSLEGPAAARQRLAQVLAVLRSPDRPGAFSAIAEDQRLVDLIVQWPGESPENLWRDMVERLRELAEAQRCLRCGTCCRVSSPTLYQDDLESIRQGHIKRNNLFTLRAGELAKSARLGKTMVLDLELIKLRERAQGGCLNLDDHLCRHYDYRPLQCRNLECWSGCHAGALEDHPRLTRNDIYRGDTVALELMREFEIKLPAAVLRESLEAASADDEEAAFKVIEIITLDARLRAAIKKKYGYQENEQELLFGRDALSVVRASGFIINLDDEEHPTLKRS